MDDLQIQAIKREERLSDRVVKQLEELIVSGRLEPGRRLPPERELAGMFGVSRTVIREAVHNLAAKSLLETRTGGGTYVTGRSTDSVAESLSFLLRSRAEGLYVEHLQEVRRVLEVEIAGLAAQRATDEDLADLADILNRMEEAKGDNETSATLDVEFHQALAVATRNPVFIILLASIADLLLDLRRMALADPATQPKALYHHRNVLQMVRTRDVASAREAMAAHIRQSDETMQGILKARGIPGQFPRQTTSG